MNLFNFSEILWKRIGQIFKMDQLGEPMDIEIIPVTDDAKNVDSEQIDVEIFNSNNMQQHAEVRKY